MKLPLSSLVVLAIILGFFAIVGYGAATADEVRNTFTDIGCTGCHNGQTAIAYDDLVNKVRAWGSEYGTIDEAVKEEVTYFGGQKFNSFDELMQTMAGNVGKTIDDPEIVQIKQFLQDQFAQGKQSPPPTNQEPATSSESEGGTNSTPFYAAVALGVLVAVVLAALFARR
ncbi:MAG: hypothetical protein F7C32_01090 [Desulfurococcales archaeon]|nr:hypothetical protein [Desulfurococcales archaeon]